MVLENGSHLCLYYPYIQYFRCQESTKEDNVGQRVVLSLERSKISFETIVILCEIYLFVATLSCK